MLFGFFFFFWGPRSRSCSWMLPVRLFLSITCAQSGRRRWGNLQENGKKKKRLVVFQKILQRPKKFFLLPSRCAYDMTSKEAPDGPPLCTTTEYQSVYGVALNTIMDISARLGPLLKMRCRLSLASSQDEPREQGQCDQPTPPAYSSLIKHGPF